MIDGLVIDLPILALFLKFMIASTLLLGSVWVLEKIGVINTPDMSETAWKLAIVASFIALLPVSFAPSNLTIPIEQSVAVEYGALPYRPAPEATDTGTIDQAVDRNGNTSANNPRRPDTTQSADIARPSVPQLRSSDGAVVSLPTQETLRQKTLGQEISGQKPLASAATSQALNAPAPQPAPSPEAVLSRQDTPVATAASGPVSVQPRVTQPASTISIDILLISAWAALAVLALAMLVVSYSRAIKSLGSRKRVPAEHHANRTLRTLCEAVDIRHVPYLSRSSEINSPVCLPRREICLPDWAFEDMDEKALDSLIAHELAHMLRRDPAMMIITQTLSRVFFFQPLFALARKRLEDNAELAADQWAATHLSTAKAVATALYTCAQKITEKRQLQWGLAMAGDKSILKQRVERLLKADGASFNTTGRLKRGGVAAILLAAVVSLPGIEFATAMTAGHPHDIPDEREIERLVREAEREVRRSARLAEVEARRAARLADQIRAKEAHKNSRMTLESLEGLESLEELDELAELEALKDLEHLNDFEFSFAMDEDARLSIERAAEEAARVAVHATELAASAAAEAMVDVARHPGIKRHFRSDSGHQSGNMQWTTDGQSIKVKWEGRFTLTDDETGIESIERDGLLNIRTKDGKERRRIRMENEDGTIETTYWLNGDKQALDSNGEKWLAQTIQLLVRNSAIDMENRIERYLSKGGTKLAFKKFDELEGDYVRRVFASELIDQADLDEGETKSLIKAYKVVESDYETRLFMDDMIDADLITKKTLGDALGLTADMDSDYELRLALTPLLEEFAFDDKDMERVLDRALKIESDYELRLLLSAAMDSGELSKGNQKRLIKAAQSIDSDYELRLVISQFADEATMDAGMTTDLLQAIRAIEGDYEKRLALAAVVDEGSMNEANWMQAIKVAETIEGDYEKRLALAQIKDDLPNDSKLEKAFTEAAKTIDGDYEREMLLGK